MDLQKSSRRERAFSISRAWFFALQALALLATVVGLGGEGFAPGNPVTPWFAYASILLPNSVYILFEGQAWPLDTIATATIEIVLVAAANLAWACAIWRWAPFRISARAFVLVVTLWFALSFLLWATAVLWFTGFLTP